MNEKTLTLTLTEREVREVVAALKNKRGTLEAYVAANTNSITSKPIDAELGEMFEVRRTEVDDLITKVLAVKADEIVKPTEPELRRPDDVSAQEQTHITTTGTGFGMQPRI